MTRCAWTRPLRTCSGQSPAPLADASRFFLSSPKKAGDTRPRRDDSICLRNRHRGLRPPPSLRSPQNEPPTPSAQGLQAPVENQRAREKRLKTAGVGPRAPDDLPSPRHARLPAPRGVSFSSGQGCGHHSAQRHPPQPSPGPCSAAQHAGASGSWPTGAGPAGARRTHLQRAGHRGVQQQQAVQRAPGELAGVQAVALVQRGGHPDSAVCGSGRGEKGQVKGRLSRQVLSVMSLLLSMFMEENTLVLANML